MSDRDEHREDIEIERYEAAQDAKAMDLDDQEDAKVRAYLPRERERARKDSLMDEVRRTLREHRRLAGVLAFGQ